ncbi:MAG: efflux RND transporter periplasmic adaptor subunit [Verrucomicrobiota bacterium]
MSHHKQALDDLRIDRSEPARSHGWLWVLLALLAILGAAGVGWWMTRSQPLEVRTLVVREAGSSSSQRTVLNASGYVVARREATVSSKVTGKVVEVLVEEGMRVTENQVLARLDTSNVQANLDLAEAQAAAARRALNETKVRLAEAERELHRITDLANEKVASAAQLDRAQAEVESLQARLDRQQGEVIVADRQVALWQQHLDDNIIRAPFTGIVTSKNAQPGEMISPISAGGGFTRTGICTIVDMTSLEIEVDVNESYINRVETGQAVESTLDAYPDWKIPSKVIAIVPTADRQKATVKVRVGFEKLDPRILPQMGVKVAFRSSADEPPAARAAIVVPKSAVRQEGGQAIVYVLANGRVERRSITTGASRDDQLTVLAGLVSGEKIILEPLDKIQNGDRAEEKRR